MIKKFNYLTFGSVVSGVNVDQTKLSSTSTFQNFRQR